MNVLKVIMHRRSDGTEKFFMITPKLQYILFIFYRYKMNEIGNINAENRSQVDQVRYSKILFTEKYSPLFYFRPFACIVVKIV